MNAARIGVLVLAIVAAGLAALLARGLVSSGKEEAVAEKVVEEPTTEVLVAVSNLQLGQRLTGGDLRWQRWPMPTMLQELIVVLRKSQKGYMEISWIWRNTLRLRSELR